MKDHNKSKFLIGLIKAIFSGIAILACGFINSSGGKDLSTSQVQSTSVQSGIPIWASPIRLVIPAGLGTGASAETIDVITDQEGQSWEIAPSHLQLTLQGYALQSSFHVPQFFVYPAPDYTAVNLSAATSIQQLKEILSNQNLPAQNDALPKIPFWNAGQVFGSQEKVIQFNGGSGLRLVTQYAQDVSPINNGGLFYLFEGLTTDQKIYIVGILPTNLAFLPVDNNPSSSLPAGGIPFPQDNSSGSNFEDYFTRVTELINNSSADQFNPSLNTLDALIQSISTQ